jgi:2-polyprenyl-3-methyl-5-hydroxy-6-metoxy-1,4-benzoquinol methylase
VSQSDRERWNARWSQREQDGARSQPSPWIASLGAIVPSAGRALDVAGGAGRHAVWLARRGLGVTLADVSDEGLRLAAAAARDAGVEVDLVHIDLEREPLPAGAWDLIVCVHYLQRSLFPAIAAELAPGGLLLFCHQTRVNLERHARPGPAYLLEEGEAATLVAGLEILSCDEGWQEDGRHEARLIARRSATKPGAQTAR